MTEKQWTVGVAAAVVQDGRVLMVRHTYSEKGARWALPGGFSQHDECLDESAVRELYEETGLVAKVVDAIALVTRVTERGGATFVVFRMRPVTEAPSPVPDGVEVDGVNWFTAQEIAAMTKDELWYDIRNPTLAALTGSTGFVEDPHYPGRTESNRGFIVPFDRID